MPSGNMEIYVPSNTGLVAGFYLASDSNII
jgi:hypothetical protein